MDAWPLKDGANNSNDIHDNDNNSKIMGIWVIGHGATLELKRQAMRMKKMVVALTRG